MATKRSLKVLDRLAVEGRTAFTTAEVRSALKLSPQATSNLLSRLVVEGLVDRVAGGRYVLRPIGALGTQAVWDDLGSAVAAAFTGNPHRIGFLTAPDHHGLLTRPVRTVQAASSYRPRLKTLSGRPLQVVHEKTATLLVATERLGPSWVATVERALLDVAGHPYLMGGSGRLAEALVAVTTTSGLAELAQWLDAIPAYRRVGSISTALSLSVGRNLQPPPWYSLIELDPQESHVDGWVDKLWGVAWPYPASELAAVAAR
ncbi:MAG: type IV toxin-antitoxin system AbiEi family antitoxin domain-containing protein [Candidatus Dormibacteria bacterium]